MKRKYDALQMKENAPDVNNCGDVLLIGPDEREGCPFNGDLQREGKFLTSALNAFTASIFVDLCDTHYHYLLIISIRK